MTTAYGGTYSCATPECPALISDVNGTLKQYCNDCIIVRKREQNKLSKERRKIGF